MTDQPSLFGDSFQPDREPPKPKKVSGEASHVSVPLAERMRPRSLDEFLGQEKVIGPDTLLRKAVEKGAIPSLILWGPPASGKTTLALLLSKHTQARFVTLSAVTSGVKDIREAVENARQIRDHSGTGTVLFIDEIHRFNKSQQDALLPHVEKGLFTLIGATTENPSFEVNGALLSRCRVYVLEPLAVESIVRLLRLALEDCERGYGKRTIEVADESLAALAEACHGDPRSALNSLQLAVEAHPGDPLSLTKDLLLEALQKKALLYDKSGEEHFNLISAFHKSLRGSDPDAALYWLARMLAAGEEPLYVAR
ncbi:MAG: replication-associated recombination protein A, partial [Candidatus Omnitrophica bacterium]|nr:replication-associated recombination protein A [Candidatus Omnitrophota bacterium]